MLRAFNIRRSDQEAPAEASGSGPAMEGEPTSDRESAKETDDEESGNGSKKKKRPKSRSKKEKERKKLKRREKARKSKESSDDETSDEEPQSKKGKRKDKGINSKLLPTGGVNKKSALGRLFKQVRQTSARLSPSSSGSSSSSEDSDSESSGSSDESESESEDSSSDSSSESSGSDDERSRKRSRKNRHRGSKKRRRSKDRKRKHHRVPTSSIKPIPPEKYGGAADLPKYMQFVQQCNNYLIDGRVEPRRHITVVANFLTGKAWTFYTREVSRKPGDWTLEEFFKGLFNACFPVDFRNKQRDKLKEFKQGSLTVREYISELEDLVVMVGDLSKRTQTIALFNGFKSSIRRGLYKANIDPETVSWKKIVAKAEFLERADS
ncbi:hypothetical protein H0H93_012727, partial [Arthromyces matolae]